MSANPLFPTFRALGDATPFAAQIRAVVGHNALFDDFSEADLRQLGPFMRVFVAPPGGVIIREGDAGDFMLFVIDGLVDITKKRSARRRQAHRRRQGRSGAGGDVDD